MSENYITNKIEWKDKFDYFYVARLKYFPVGLYRMSVKI